MFFCDENLVEDEYHFVIECNAYAAIRAKYIKKILYREEKYV